MSDREILTDVSSIAVQSQYPLSASQRALWQLNQVNQYCNIYKAYVFEGDLDVDSLSSSFETLIERHDSLRTVFKKDKRGEVKQSIQSLIQVNFKIEHIDLRQEKEAEIFLESAAQSDLLKPFDLSTASSAIRASLYQLTENKWVLTCVMHPIIGDDWSMDILIEELFQLYHAYVKGEANPLAPLSTQYKDYIIWQQSQFVGDKLKVHKDYWLKRFEGDVPALELSPDKVRSAVKTHKRDIINKTINSAASKSLKDFCHEQEGTLFMGLLATVNILLYKYTGQQDIVIGTLAEGRENTSFRDQVGPYNNKLALRTQFEGGDSFSDLANNIKQVILDAYVHQFYPFNELVDALQLQRDSGRNPLFNVMVVLQNNPIGKSIKQSLGTLKVRECQEVHYSTSEVDLVFTFIEASEGIQVSIEYNGDLFNRATVLRLAAHLDQLLAIVTTQPDQPINQLTLVDKVEEHQLLYSFNNKTVAYPDHKTIVDIFQEQVDKTPDAVAVVFEKTELNYQQLNAVSNQLAQYLRKHYQIQPDDLVGIQLERSHWMIVAILGTLKAGAAYVPMDPEHPRERVEYIIEDCSCKVLIGQEELEKFISEKDEYSTENQSTLLRPHHLVYCIYTSGSTGKPKGVLLEHQGLVNHIHNVKDYYKVDEHSRFLQFFNIAFDAAAQEIFTSLSFGASLYIRSHHELGIDKILHLLNTHHITHADFTPGYFESLLTNMSLSALRHQLVSCGIGGEKVDKGFILRNRERISLFTKHFFNVYGPTESTLTATIFNILEDEDSNERKTVPIGQPYPNRSVLILDANDKLVPIGVVGEICIGGAGLARGYLNNEELTRQKFISHPYKTGERLYKTGDLGRLLDDGNIEFVGRKDDQVKIRGFRIELAEIEKVLQQTALVNQCVVIVKEDHPNNKSLVTYYVPDEPQLQQIATSLFQKQVENWQNTSTHNYQDTQQTNDEEFNITGWMDSFTGRPIPAAQMQEWQNNIIQTTLRYQPQHVLEIGCGTGLIYYPLSYHIKSYTGFDLSAAAIQQIQARIAKKERNYPATRLDVSAADKIEIVDNRPIDTIVINSVIQYFPGEDYLLNVIGKSLSLLKGKGRVIIGDVRHNGLQTLFKSRLLLQKASPDQSLHEFQWEIERKVLTDKELCVSPNFFYWLKEFFPEIAHIDIELKRGDYTNEMNLYRYDVILHTGIQQEEILQPKWQECRTTADKSNIIQQFQSQAPVIAIRGMANPRLHMEAAIAQGLLDKGIRSIKDLVSYIEQTSVIAVDVAKEVLLCGEAHGYNCRMLVNEDPLKMNVVLVLSADSRYIANAFEGDKYQGADVSNPLFYEVSLELQKQLRHRLSEQLPEYMVPAQYIAVRQLPLTANGKIDRKFLSSYKIQSSVTANYVAPVTETERQLATIWRELLNADRIGIHDNFFELGGDSIIGIQVVSRAHRLGYALKPKDLFTHQTIAGLAFMVHQLDSMTTSGEQDLLTGSCGLLPIQQCFFEQLHAAPSHMNQSMLLGISKAVSFQDLELAMQHIIRHHDSLRFQYSAAPLGWEQHYGVYEGEVIIEDLQQATTAYWEQLVEQRAHYYQSTLSINEGILVRAVLFKTPAQQVYDRLLIVIHHLAIDGVSWRILLEDLEVLLTALKQNAIPVLRHKTSSYRQWHEALVHYSNSERLQAQKPYWNKVVQAYTPLPIDYHYAQALTATDIDKYSVHLSATQTQRLLQEVPKVYHTEINDILLAALAKTLSEWSGQDKIVIGLEGHGREEIANGIDLSRTVGWFTSLYPVLLDKAKEDQSYSNWIKSIKEQLRQIPDKGIGYGVLKYINQEECLQKDLPWDIVFNYLGQLENAFSQTEWIVSAGESLIEDMDQDNIVNDKLAVNSIIKEGRLVLDWSYSTKHYNSVTIQQLSHSYLSNLESLIEHCLNLNKSGSIYTPSDYGLGAVISYQELDEFFYTSINGQPRRNLLSGLYRLTALQEGMLFHSLYDKKSESYITQLRYELNNVQLETFVNSWQCLLKQHSILRSSFHNDDFKLPVQCVHHEVSLPIEQIDCRDLKPWQQQQDIQAYAEADRQRNFDFTSAPLMRLTLFRLGEYRYHMLWTAHHILMDGWSASVLLQELITTYESLMRGEPIIILEDNYQDYIRYVDNKDAWQQQLYWKQYMQPIEQSSLLPFISLTAERNKGLGLYKSTRLSLDANFTSNLVTYSQKHHLTINTIMQAVWCYLLHRYTGQATVVYGVTVSGRPEDLPVAESRVGLYINTLPLRATIKADQLISEWLQALQQEQIENREYQYSSLAQIQQWAGIPGDLFDSLLVYDNYPVNKQKPAQPWTLQIDSVQVVEHTNYPLTITISAAETIDICFAYNSTLLHTNHIELIKGHFEKVLLEILGKAGKLRDIEMLTAAERNQLLYDFNDTATGYPKEKTIVALFEEQVKSTPDHTAVVFEDKVLSYRELNAVSNRLAHYLIEHYHILPDDLIGIKLDRSEWMIAAILGALKAGGAYLPIDPGYPQDRIDYIVQDSKCKVVIGEEELIAFEGNMDRYVVDDHNTGVQPGNLIHCIYTSGSTGKPKGVTVSHHSVVNLIHYQKRMFAIDQSDRILQFSTISFDASVEQIWLALLSGATLVLPGKAVITDNIQFNRFLLKHGVTHLHTTPSFLETIEIHTPNSLKRIIAGGEECKLALAQKFCKQYKFYNEYGPTETTVTSIECLITTKHTDIGKVPIGKPIGNTDVYILDELLQLVPIGVVGELCIGGAGIAIGYLGNEELTKQKFIDNPYKERERLYKTGDLGRWLEDGSIEYAGRKDDQVKIRGFRIELGEIEAVLLQSSFVDQCVVLAKEDTTGNKQLIAYIVAKGKFDREDIQAYIKAKLPDYMVPSILMELEALPLTASGKVDKKALPKADIGTLANSYVAPRNEVERKLGEIWKELLGIEKVSVHDSFFKAGGHSLLVMRMVSAIKKEWAFNIPVAIVFESPCIADISTHIEVFAMMKTEVHGAGVQVFEL